MGGEGEPAELAAIIRSRRLAPRGLRSTVRFRRTLSPDPNVRCSISRDFVATHPSGAVPSTSCGTKRGICPAGAFSLTVAAQPSTLQAVDGFPVSACSSTRTCRNHGPTQTLPARAFLMRWRPCRPSADSAGACGNAGDTSKFLFAHPDSARKRKQLNLFSSPPGSGERKRQFTNRRMRTFIATPRARNVNNTEDPP